MRRRWSEGLRRMVGESRIRSPIGLLRLACDRRFHPVNQNARSIPADTLAAVANFASMHEALVWPGLCAHNLQRTRLVPVCRSRQTLQYFYGAQNQSVSTDRSRLGGRVMYFT